jgi:pimeloyl-ACP methyl ester carboxylesterase
MITMPEFATATDLVSALKRYDQEVTQDWVMTPRYRLKYLIWGPSDGFPLILIHGLCDTPRSFAMLMARLVDRGIRCISYYLADGRGDRARLGAYKHADFTADLIALLDHLRIDQVDLLGSSFGSTISLRSLSDHPARFRRGILQGGFARRPLLAIERGLARLGRYWPWRMGELPIREWVMTKLEAAQFVGCPPEIFRFLLDNSGLTPIRAAARRALLLDQLDLRSRLPRIPHPVLLIGGDRDTIVPRMYEAEVEAGLPRVHRIEFSPCGHYPQYTLPVPMADAVARFCRGESTPF